MLYNSNFYHSFRKLLRELPDSIKWTEFITGILHLITEERSHRLRKKLSCIMINNNPVYLSSIKDIDPLKMKAEILNGYTTYSKYYLKKYICPKSYREYKIDEILQKRKIKFIDNYLLAGKTGALSPFKVYAAIDRHYSLKVKEELKELYKKSRTKYYNHWYWIAVRNYVKARDKQCYFCHSIENLDVHHRPVYYSNIGEEHYNPSKYLMVLCRNCHNIYHGYIKKDGKLIYIN